MTQNSPGWQPPSFDPPADPEGAQVEDQATANPATAHPVQGESAPGSAAPTWETPGGQANPGWQAPGAQQPVSSAPVWSSPPGQPQPVQPSSAQPSSAQPPSGGPGWMPAPAGWRPAGPMPPAWAQGQPQGQGQWQAGPRPIAYPSPVRFEGVPGEPFALAILPTPTVVSGISVGALVAGIGSVLVSVAVWCFGLAGSSEGWGALVGGAFFVLAALLGLAGVGLGAGGLRNIRRDLTKVSTGKGYAITGIACGGFGVLSAILGLVTAILLSRGA